jgi:hypothetical protein
MTVMVILTIFSIATVCMAGKQAKIGGNGKIVVKLHHQTVLSKAIKQNGRNEMRKEKGNDGPRKGHKLIAKEDIRKLNGIVLDEYPLDLALYSSAETAVLLKKSHLTFLKRPTIFW